MLWIVAILQCCLRRVISHSEAWQFGCGDDLTKSCCCVFQQVANRFYNSHALVNLALSYRRGDSGNLEDLKIAVGCPTLFREGKSEFLTVKLTQ